MKIFFIVIGALLVLEGIPYLFFPEKARSWALSLADAPVRGLRVLGLITVAAGAFILLLMNLF